MSRTHAASAAAPSRLPVLPAPVRAAHRLWLAAIGAGIRTWSSPPAG